MTDSPSTRTVLIIPPENIDDLMMALMFEAVTVQLLLESSGGDPWSVE